MRDKVFTIPTGTAFFTGACLGLTEWRSASAWWRAARTDRFERDYHHVANATRRTGASGHVPIGIGTLGNVAATYPCHRRAG